MTALTIQPLSPDRWSALEDLFGRGGASNGCWCMYWRIGSAYGKRPREKNKAEFQAIVENGPPPGLLAFDGELPVGWCQLTPRSVLPWLASSRITRPVDEAPVWAVSCFYIRRTHRRQGVMAALIDAAISAARQAGAPALEAYPVDTSAAGHTSNSYTGIAETFRRAGFVTVDQRSPSRPIMRHDLRSDGIG